MSVKNKQLVFCRSLFEYQAFQYLPLLLKSMPIYDGQINDTSIDGVHVNLHRDIV